MAYIGSMTEERQQEALVTYIQLQYPAVRYCASLGGQYQQYQSQRSKAIKTGYVKGFPDLQITEARKGFHGLFIELKSQFFRGCPQTVLVRNADFPAVRCGRPVFAAVAMAFRMMGGELTFAASAIRRRR